MLKNRLYPTPTKNHSPIGAIARWLAGCAAAMILIMPAAAEVSEVRLARQFGIHYLPMVIMEHQKMVEQEAKALGINTLKVSWPQISGGASSNDSLLSGAIDFAAVGTGPLIVLWDKSKGIMDVKAVAAVSDVPMTLTTRNPKVTKLEDLTDMDKIALPAAKTSMQAITLQMAAAKIWGDANYDKLDRLTVSMRHPDGMATMLSGQGEVTAHFTAAPYDFQELENPNIRKILTSYDVYGGSATLIVLTATTKFHDQNPKVTKAILAALEKAMDLIKKNPRQAAEIYLTMTKEKTSVDAMVKMITDPLIRFTTTPSSIYPTAQFMHKVGRIKNMPASWKDLFFPDVHGLPGS